MSNNPLFEGLEYGDLKRLVEPRLHIDEFESKMGSDEDIIVLSFKVDGKEPAYNLMNFIERGYDWVLDSDVSAGELDDGEYLVFVELERNSEAPDNIQKLVEDILNLTEQSISDWQFQYRKITKLYSLDETTIASIVPTSAAAYLHKFPKEEPEEIAADDEVEAAAELDTDIAAMQESARVPMKRSAPVDAWTDSVRIAAGLK